jgi:hypothetical protein
MKRWTYVALLLCSGAQAGELLPMTGQQSEHMQRALNERLAPVVAAMPDGVKVQPILESIDIAGRGKRIFWGPLAGSSHIVLRVQIIAGDASIEQTFSEHGGAWKGTFRPGRDYQMLADIATQAAQFVSAHR